MSRLLIITLFLGVFIQNGFSCSMFKLTMYGKTIVGNNEDFWNPNTRIWFEKGKDKEYGAAFVGFDNFIPQGGFNQAGLVFDGFALPFKAIKDAPDKLIPQRNFLSNILKKCATVDDVKIYLEDFNNSYLQSGMLLFVDKTGKYLIAEGDSIITGSNPYYVLSNFRPSHIKDDSEIKIPLYHRGKKLLESARDTSISYCASVLDSMHQEAKWGFGTMYSTLYDLAEGNIYVYAYHEFQHSIKLNLDDELEKGNHIMIIPELFPDNKEGLGFLNRYNETIAEINLLRNEDLVNDSIRLNYVVQTLLRKDPRLIRTFEGMINEIGAVCLAITKYKEAIAVLKVSERVSPASWVVYELLADAYMKINETKLALINYEKSVKLNPENLMGKHQIERIKADRGR